MDVFCFSLPALIKTKKQKSKRKKNKKKQGCCNPLTTAIRIFSLWFFPVRAFRKGQGLGWGGIDVGICVGVSVRVCVTAASSSRWFGIGGSVSGHSNFGEGWRGRSSLGWLHSPVFWGGGWEGEPPQLPWVGLEERSPSG